MSTKEQAGSLLDALLLESLYLVEEHAKCSVNLERLVNNGRLSLAQQRYQNSSMAITVAQIPNENSAEFNALCRVENKENDNSVFGAEATLDRHAVDKAAGYVEPLNWFSKLPSLALRNAVVQFKKGVEVTVEGANITRELSAVLESIQKLNSYITKKFNNVEVER